MLQPRVMYIEQKTDGKRWLGDRGPAEIGEVTFSQTGRTVYFKGRSFRRANCGGGGNFTCVETGDSYWISGVKKRGSNRHWAGGGPIVGQEFNPTKLSQAQIRRSPAEPPTGSSGNLLSARDDILVPVKAPPPMDVKVSINGVVHCPNCGGTFRLEPRYWDGSRHKRCGQRLRLVYSNGWGKMRNREIAKHRASESS